MKKLGEHIEYVKDLKEQGLSYKEIIEAIKRDLGLEVDRKTIWRLIKSEQPEEEAKEDIKLKDKKIIEFCQSKNLELKDIEALLYNNIVSEKKLYNVHIGTNKKLKLGIVSDQHLGSKVCKIDELHRFYELAGKDGVEAFVSAGDLVDGQDIYSGHIYELSKIGMEEQTQEVIKNYPRYKDLKTYTILGNHDEARVKKAGQNIGNIIKPFRDDLEFLGFYNANVILNGINIELHHGGGGNSYAHCFDDQTEILTDNGRKLFKDLLKHDKVATLNKDTNDFEWQSPISYVNQFYKGDMYYFKSRTVDCMVTPNHRMYVKRYKGQCNHLENLEYPTKSHKRIDWDYKFEYAEDLYNYEGNIRQRRNFTKINNLYEGIKNVDDIIEIPKIPLLKYGYSTHIIDKISLEDLVEFIGRFTTEGSASNGKNHYSIHIHQYKEVNPDKYNRIEYLIDKITNGRYGKDDYSITIHSKNFYKFVTELCGIGFANKFVPKWVKELPHKYLRILFDAMIAGDGWISKQNQIGYSSANKILAEDLGEIAQKLGYGVSYNFRPNEGNNGMYIVNISSIQTHPTINDRPLKKYYEGFIYCVEVPNSIIMVRRNGKTLWTGNSYKLQKYLESINPHNAPDIYVLGHFHSSLYMCYKGINAFMPGSWQGPTNLSKRFKLGNNVGGWIVEIEKNGNETICYSKYIDFTR